MKLKFIRRCLCFVLTVALLVCMLPSSVFAFVQVTPTPAQSDDTTLDVQYFTATLYNWDEAAANLATAAVDYNASTTSYGINCTTAADATAWTFTAVDGTTNGYYITVEVDGTVMYLTWTGANSADATLTTEPTVVTLTDYSATSGSGRNQTTINYMSLSVETGSYPYLNFYSTSQGFGGWSSSASSDEGSRCAIVATASTTTSSFLATSSIVSGSTYYIYNYRGNSSSVPFVTYTASTSGVYEDNAFYFTGADNKSYTTSLAAFSKWSSSSQNYSIYSGLAAATLSESSNAPFSDDVNVANLFATDGSNSAYTDVYTNVGVPFVYDSESGYYVFDSDLYGVYFADTDGDGTVDAASDTNLQIADLPSAYVSCYSSGSGSDGTYVGFAPFNALTTTTTSGKNSTKTATTGYAIDTTETSYGSSYSVVYGFGMVVDVSFQMTDDGKLDGEDITFEFSGDDDVWVYIDGVLVLDIGGTHDAITGTINFATGDVTLTYANSSSYTAYENVIDLAGIYTDTNDDGDLIQTNIYTALSTTLAGFASEGTHTLTVYYMDRGQSNTNCKIKFNLPQRDSVTVTKNITQKATTTEGSSEVTYEALTEYEQAVIDNVSFGFTLYTTGGTAVANKTYSIYDADGNLTGTASTDSSGHFYLKNGQTAKFSVEFEDGDSYYVIEDERGGYSDTPTWKTVASTTYATTTSAGSGLTSDTITIVTKDDDAAEMISFVCTNYLTVVLPNPGILTDDDTIVIDYGLPVTITVLDNDLVNVSASGTVTVTGVGVYDENTDYSDGTATDDSGNPESTTATVETTTVTGKYGTATVNDDGTITYTLTQEMTGVEILVYEVKVADSTTTEGTGETNVAWCYGTGMIYIVPATSVYYEANFGTAVTNTEDSTIDYGLISYSDATVKWTLTGTSSITDTTTQEDGVVGGGYSTYGTDVFYLSELGNSGGTTMTANTTSSKGAQFTYSFTGTGTTIYATINNDGAYIRVQVYDEEGNLVDRQYIETQVLQSVGSEEATTLYTCPVYETLDLDWGTYTVKVYVYKSGINLASGASGSTFSLDGVRIYGTMNYEVDAEMNPDAYTEQQIAYGAYAQDSESNTATVTMEAKVVSDNSSSTFYTLTDNQINEITDISEYALIGPNNELYLDGAGYTVSFQLVNWDTQSYKLYLGLRAPSGAENVQISINGTTVDVTNSLECYYDISSYLTVSDNVATVTLTGVSGLVGITGIKVTGTSEFTLVVGDEEAEVTDNSNLDDASGIGIEVSALSIDGFATLDIVVAEEETQTANVLYLKPCSTTGDTSAEEPVEEEPEAEAEEEDTVFVPTSMKVSAVYAKLLKIATVTVTTSTDVASVTINGQEASCVNMLGLLRIWSVSFTKAASGTTYEIIAYDADGNASEPTYVTA